MTLNRSSDPSSETHTAIMEATYRALRATGYASLTIQDIADEFEKSKSLLYYHYDTKDELLGDFLRWLLERFTDRLDDTDHDTPDDELTALLDCLLPTEMDDEGRQFRTAMFEIRALAPSDETYRDQFERSDDLLAERLSDVLRRGIESGRFDDVDPETTAQFLLSVVTGAIDRSVTRGDDEPLERTKRALDAYVETQVRAGNAR